MKVVGHFPNSIGERGQMAFAPGRRAGAGVRSPTSVGWAAFHNKLIPRHSFMRPLAHPFPLSPLFFCEQKQPETFPSSILLSLSPTLMYPPYRPREWRTAGGRAGGTPASLPLPPPAASSSLTSSSIPPGEKVIFLLCCLSLFTLLGRRNEGDLPASCYPNQLEGGGRPESRAWRAGSVTDIARRLTSDAASIERAIRSYSSAQRKLFVQPL